jgi:disulfide bond formation protein DsbB
MKRVPLRLVYLGIALFCWASAGFALYMQHYEFVLPCPLCIFQRIGVIACGALASIAVLFPLPKRPLFWPVLIALAAIAGAGVSIRHIQIQQSLASAEPQSCGAGLDFMLQTQSLPTVIASVLAGHGDCTVIDWHLGFLTLPMLALAGFVVIGLALMFAAAQGRAVKE